MKKVKGKKKPVDYNLGSVKLSEVKKMIASLEAGPLEDPDLTFSFLVNSLFKEVPKNMERNLKNEYDRGFREGYAAASNELVKLP